MNNRKQLVRDLALGDMNIEQKLLYASVCGSVELAIKTGNVSLAASMFLDSVASFIAHHETPLDILCVVVAELVRSSSGHKCSDTLHTITEDEARSALIATLQESRPTEQPTTTDVDMERTACEVSDLLNRFRKPKE